MLRIFSSAAMPGNDTAAATTATVAALRKIFIRIPTPPDRRAEPGSMREFSRDGPQESIPTRHAQRTLTDRDGAASFPRRSLRHRIYGRDRGRAGGSRLGFRTARD